MFGERSYVVFVWLNQIYLRTSSRLLQVLLKTNKQTEIICRKFNILIT